MTNLVLPKVYKAIDKSKLDESNEKRITDGLKAQ